MANVRNDGFLLPPVFLSSHDSGMLAKKLHLKKEKLILIMKKIKIKIKIAKINKYFYGHCPLWPTNA